MMLCHLLHHGGVAAKIMYGHSHTWDQEKTQAHELHCTTIGTNYADKRHIAVVVNL